MESAKQSDNNDGSTAKDEVPPPLLIRFTTKAMRLFFIVDMLGRTMTPSSTLTCFSNKGLLYWSIAYSAIISAWGFLVWMERAYRKKRNLQPSRCTKIICSRCDTIKKHPRWFKYKYGLYFLLTYVAQTWLVWMIQVSPFFIEHTIDEGREEPSFVPVTVSIMMAHMMTVYLFKVYYLHIDLLKMNSSSVADKESGNRKGRDLVLNQPQ
ncbi:hypothetical protein SEUBUCD646_0G03250 [Saccharomyces eubayanus]|uniref:YPR071W-like protein n=1 Tax=Saccharomyces eubayanus TaxID=1080349 RepID=A0ABN8VVE1_SACEU|nr:hypothetical protein SEUBUCD650_0G03230 [Saccharomyces eubayanus]CAI2023080.1 hypothetical protein SEUBUCD646_0G03250 [Saccharomyces eubayanus]